MKKTILTFVIFFVVFIIVYPTLDWLWATFITKSPWTLNIGAVAFRALPFCIIFTILENVAFKKK